MLSRQVWTNLTSNAAVAIKYRAYACKIPASARSKLTRVSTIKQVSSWLRYPSISMGGEFDLNGVCEDRYGTKPMTMANGGVATRPGLDRSSSSSLFLQRSKLLSNCRALLHHGTRSTR